ncbi:hypothetical protein SKAU_G00388710 [Synaphobranchus kaupii]|uniref:Uncharacterized protein n=1 Tax=Synaphobranchus kaupii TaxID=118154 RepID=A0A9Q1EB38_SYNKA|nr:hypothetical protein SKAU_G00388710 [Synaphobranchus kaupii]
MAQKHRDTCPNGCIQQHLTSFLDLFKRMRVLPQLILSVIFPYFMAFPGFSESWTSNKKPRCFNKDDNLTKIAEHLLKKSRHRYSNETPVVLRPTKPLPKPDCSKLNLDYSSRLYNNRSVSPWRVSNNHDEERYPVDISVAECLCDGCIINGIQNRSYNSVLVMYSKEVLKRSVCPRNQAKYRFEVLYVSQPIACTCVRANVVHNSHR